MTANEIIEIGQEIYLYDSSMFSTIGLWAYIVLVILIIGALYPLITRKDLRVKYGNQYGDFSKYGSLVFISIVGIICFLMITSMYNDKIDTEVKNNMIESWKVDYAYPYINSLPKQKYTIIHIKPDPEIETRGNRYHVQSNRLVAMYIMYKTTDGAVYDYTNWVRTDMSLTKEEKPYIEYQYLDTNLGYGVDHGIYNAKVYLPENYEFKEIK